MHIMQYVYNSVSKFYGTKYELQVRKRALLARINLQRGKLAQNLLS